MKIQLQKFIHKYSSYSRPNQSWSCGKQAQGYQCDAGPDAQGQCRTQYECTPYKKDARWICTRNNSQGGRCTEGPLANGDCCKQVVSCQPIRSIRGKRKLLVKWTVFTTFAVLMFFLSSHLRAEFFSPGDLSFKHAKIQECSTCHAVFDTSSFEWIKQALSGNFLIHNSNKCLDCHQFGEHAHDAHGLKADELKQLTPNKVKPEKSDKKQLACLNCHLEHHGENTDLTNVAKQNCAYCHDIEKSMTQNKHPEFTQYPFKQNTKIIFDHFTHSKKYYYNRAGDQLLETAPESCLSCHKSDDSGINMGQQSYDNDCKACHNEIFEESESFIVFDIPELAFEASELNAQWPEDARGTLTHFMILLLASDPLFTEAVTDLEDYFDLSELNKTNTLKLIKSIKNLYFEIDNKGPIALKQRLIKAFNCQFNDQGQSSCSINETELDQLVSLMPIQLLCEAKTRWFPKLDEEYKAESSHYCANNNHNSESDTGEWILEELSIEYRPTKHNNPLIKTLLNLSSRELSSALTEKTRLELFNELISEDASVQCSKCHSVESVDAKNFKVNWPASDKSSTQKEFIKFRHDAHIKYQDESICNDCHQENSKDGYLDSYEDHDPLTFESNFITDNKACLSCHQNSMTETQCQTCHNYHISPPLL